MRNEGESNRFASAHYQRIDANASFAHWQNFSAAGPSLPLRVIIPIVIRFGSGVKRKRLIRSLNAYLNASEVIATPAPAPTAEKTPDQPSCSSMRRGLAFTEAKTAFKYSKYRG